MSSRTPSPDNVERYSMPDLPGDLFDDDDSVYQATDRPAYEADPDDTAWDGEYPGYGYEDDIVDERPRRRPRRPARDDVLDEREPGRRRPYTVDDNDLDRPKRKPRRIPREELYGEPRPRKRHRREMRDDDEFVERARVRVDDERAARKMFSRARSTQNDAPRAPSRQDRVIEQPRMRTASATTADVVTSIQPSTGPAPARRRAGRQRNPAWKWEPVVLPQPRQMLEQAWPSLLVAISVLVTLALMDYLPGSLPLWAPMILLPTLVLLLRADHDRHPMWGRAATVNLVVVGAFFPMMIVRQSFLRVPFVEFGNGTLVMPVLSTIMVIFAMAVIALGSAFLSQEDPEYAGILFLPAAMLVPFFAGATEITGLATALMILGVVYIAVGILTVIASMLPAAFPTLVAPVALALEFFVLPVSESTPIFPVGAGISAKLLFFIVLAFGVGLTVAVPMLAVWVRQVRRIVRGSTTLSRLAAA